MLIDRSPKSNINDDQYARILDAQTRLLDFLIERVPQMARTISELTDELNATKTALDQKVAEFTAKITADAQTISDLQAQLANVTPAEDLQPIDDASAALSADVQGIQVPS